MMPPLTDLIKEQMKTFAVMASAGIFTETLWQLKTYANHIAVTKTKRKKRAQKIIRIIPEAAFWVIAAVALPAFLYYCAYGKISLHAAAGFLTGLLLWKKLSHGIIK